MVEIPGVVIAFMLFCVLGLAALGYLACHKWEKLLGATDEAGKLATALFEVGLLLEVIAAWQAGELSEEQACTLTGLDCFQLRTARDRANQRCQERWGEWRKANPPVLPKAPADGIVAAERRTDR